MIETVILTVIVNFMVILQSFLVICLWPAHFLDPIDPFQCLLLNKKVCTAVQQAIIPPQRKFAKNTWVHI